MNEGEFWKLIELSRRAHIGNASHQVDWLQVELEKRPGQEILDFDRLLREQMAVAFTWELWAAAYIINGGCSDDGFDYFRAWLIAQGFEVFHNALKDPETLANVAETDASLEELMYVAAKAYEVRTNTKFPRTAHPAPDISSDPFDEDEEALQTKYPKLFAKFSGSIGDSPLVPVASLLQNIMARHANIPKLEVLYGRAVIYLMEETPKSLASAIELLTQAADQGHAGAQYLLGSCLQRGKGVRQSFPQAAKRYRQAAENGNADACGALGKLYQQGLELDQDYDEALKWYKKGAELNSVDSEFGLGLMYSEGYGVEKDPQESLKWFQKAAQKGHDAAALNVGLAFLNGKEVETNPALAFKWFAQAAEAGSVRARFNMGVLHAEGRGVAQNYLKAAEMYQLAAEKGHDGAMLNLGKLYCDGKGLPQDYAKAAQYYRQAVDAGNFTALSNLAVLYMHGRGVSKDLAEAVSLYRRSAEAGVAIGQFNLGTMYERGLGVPQDDREALNWYRLAAAQINASAMNNIADAYENGRGVPQDFVEAAKWYRKAAEGGVSASQYSLGKFYRDGLGVKQDYREAVKWLKSSAEKGHEKAQLALEALQAAGQAEPPTHVVPPIVNAGLYQLVLQFRGSWLSDLDKAAALEEALVTALGDSANVDGHDIGDGETNIFIITTDPEGTFRRAMPALKRKKVLQAVMAAYRRVDGEQFAVIWPEDSKEPFVIN